MGKSKDLAGLGGGSFSKSLTITGSANDANILTTGFNQTNLSILADSTDGELRLSTEDGSGNNYTKYMTFYTEGGSGPTERMRIDASGRVTMPYQPHITGTPVNSTGSGYATSFYNAYTPTGMAFVNGKITVPVSGKYLITWNTICDTGSGRVDSFVSINHGVAYIRGLSQNSGSTGFRYRSHSGVLDLAANDYIEFSHQDYYAAYSVSYNDWNTATVTLIG